MGEGGKYSHVPLEVGVAYEVFSVLNRNIPRQLAGHHRTDDLAQQYNCFFQNYKFTVRVKYFR